MLRIKISVSKEASQPASEDTRSKRKHSKLFAITGVGLVALVVASGLAWRIYSSRHQTDNSNPFSTKIMASVQFPLYYPTKLPKGYHIDPHSITEPTNGVVVLTMDGPRNFKMYMSEEPRLSSFDLGGYYKGFSNLKLTTVSDGEIAVGRIDSGKTEIASRANLKTWVLVDTKTYTEVPLPQLTSLLRSLKLSY